MKISKVPIIIFAFLEIKLSKNEIRQHSSSAASCYIIKFLVGTRGLAYRFPNFLVVGPTTYDTAKRFFESLLPPDSRNFTYLSDWKKG